MFRCINKLFVFLVLSLLVSACATSTTSSFESKKITTAKQFLSSIGAGELAMEGMRRQFNVMYKEQPGLAELAHRAFVDIDKEDFLELMSKVYSKHMTYEHLSELVSYTEMPEINKFIKVIFSQVQSGGSINKEDVLREFTADELIVIYKFSESESFTTMAKLQPEINKDMHEAGRRLGEKIMREYLNGQ